jgi:hypothetical protein
MLRLLATVKVFPRSPIIFTLMKVATLSSEKAVLTGITQRQIPEYGNLNIHRRENIQSDIALIG